MIPGRNLNLLNTSEVGTPPGGSVAGSATGAGPCAPTGRHGIHIEHDRNREILQKPLELRLCTLPACWSEDLRDSQGFNHTRKSHSSPMPSI